MEIFEKNDYDVIIDHVATCTMYDYNENEKPKNIVNDDVGLQKYRIDEKTGKLIGVDYHDDEVCIINDEKYMEWSMKNVEVYVIME